jgi:uncharacterized protein YndB with AHSA1/START domain
MDATASSDLGTSQPRVLSFVRFLIATPEELFDAWTRPERLRQWWGPEGLELVTCEVEPRRGGAIRFAVRGPDGAVHRSHGGYLEFDPPSRLCFTEVLEDAPQETFVTTVTFEEMGAMTRMAVTQTAARAEPLASWQPVGWLESLTRLSELVLPH